MIDTFLEKNLLPDWLIRIGIRGLLAQSIREEAARYDRAAYVADLKTRALAEQTAAANEQHQDPLMHFSPLIVRGRDGSPSRPRRTDVTASPLPMRTPRRGVPTAGTKVHDRLYEVPTPFCRSRLGRRLK